MWIFTRYGFFSIVNTRNARGRPDTDMLIVQARRVSHLRHLTQRCRSLAHAEISTASHGDFRYRIVVSKLAWVAALAVLAEEQNWCDFITETTSAQGPGDYADALYRVGAIMRELQRTEMKFALVNRDADGVITNASDLTAEDLTGEKVLCPECGRKAFVDWPEGWDGHAGHACSIEGDTPEERKTAYKRRYRLLFR